MKYKAVIFDLDGTLLNTLEDIADSMNAVLDRNGFPQHSTDEYRYFVGKGFKNLVRTSLPSGQAEETTVERCYKQMLEEYDKRWANKTQPYPGIPELLGGLSEKGVKITVLSNKADEFTKRIVYKLLSKWNFAIVFGERPNVPRKPDPTSALETAGLLGLQPEDCLYLGDSGIDMLTANAAGMFAVGAVWGFRTAGELLEHGAKALAETPEDVLKFL